MRFFLGICTLILCASVVFGDLEWETQKFKDILDDRHPDNCFARVQPGQYPDKKRQWGYGSNSWDDGSQPMYPSSSSSTYQQGSTSTSTTTSPTSTSPTSTANGLDGLEHETELECFLHENGDGNIYLERSYYSSGYGGYSSGYSGYDGDSDGAPPAPDVTTGVTTGPRLHRVTCPPPYHRPACIRKKANNLIRDIADTMEGIAFSPMDFLVFFYGPDYDTAYARYECAKHAIELVGLCYFSGEPSFLNIAIGGYGYARIVCPDIDHWADLVSSYTDFSYCVSYARFGYGIDKPIALFQVPFSGINMAGRRVDNREKQYVPHHFSPNWGVHPNPNGQVRNAPAHGDQAADGNQHPNARLEQPGTPDGSEPNYFEAITPDLAGPVKHLDIIDQSRFPRDHQSANGNHYSFAQDWSSNGVVYHVDSGVYAKHPEFLDTVTHESRAIAGPRVIAPIDVDPSDGHQDYDAHGTRTLSMAIGLSIGIARKAKAIYYKVFNDSFTVNPTTGELTYYAWNLSDPDWQYGASALKFDAVLLAFEDIARIHTRPSVITFSVGIYSTVMDDIWKLVGDEYIDITHPITQSVQALIALGIPFHMAAGNSLAVDPCGTFLLQDPYHPPPYSPDYDTYWGGELWLTDGVTRVGAVDTNLSAFEDDAGTIAGDPFTCVQVWMPALGIDLIAYPPMRNITSLDPAHVLNDCPPEYQGPVRECGPLYHNKADGASFAAPLAAAVRLSHLSGIDPKILEEMTPEQVISAAYEGTLDYANWINTVGQDIEAITKIALRAFTYPGESASYTYRTLSLVPSNYQC